MSPELASDSGAHTGTQGCYRPQSRSALAGGRAGSLRGASESGHPGRGPRSAIAAQHPGCLGPRGAGAGRRAAGTVTGAPLGQWPGRRPSPSPPRARQSEDALRFKCAEGRGSPLRRQRPLHGRPRVQRIEPGSPARRVQALECEFVRAHASAARGGARTEEAPGPWSPSAEFPAATLIIGK